MPHKPAKKVSISGTRPTPAIAGGTGAEFDILTGTTSTLRRNRHAHAGQGGVTDISLAHV
jgi:hypothetical protein